MKMVEILEQMNTETEVLLTLSIILFAGFILTRLTNTLNMPKVSGYILAGILIGPYMLDLIPGEMIRKMGFISDVALAFISFGVGKFFKKEVLLSTGKRIVVITISEALAAGVLVTFGLKFIFRLDWEFALILGAISTATAPASTMMTINQYKAKGEFVNTLLQVVALDDVVCLLVFSVVSAVINGLAAGRLALSDVAWPVFYNFLAVALGIFCGYFLSRLLVIPTRSRDNRLILVIAMLLGLAGLCSALDISPLLSCMVFGAVYINLTRDKKLFRQINNFAPPIMSMFFVVSGMNLDINALKTVGAIGVSYFLIRIVGKYLGAYLSCTAVKTSREIRNYIGLALVPQAGVAIGLAFLGQRLLPEDTGKFMLTIILSSSVLYEMVGPLCAKAALFLSGSIQRQGSEESGEPEDGEVSETDTSEERGQEDMDPAEPGATEGIDPAESGALRRTREEGGPVSEGLPGKSSKKKGKKKGKPAPGEPAHADPEDELTTGLLELREYNKGVDERDDDDPERIVRHHKPQKSKKRSEKEKAGQSSAKGPRPE